LTESRDPRKSRGETKGRERDERDQKERGGEGNGGEMFKHMDTPMWLIRNVSPISGSVVRPVLTD